MKTLSQQEEVSGTRVRNRHLQDSSMLSDAVQYDIFVEKFS